MQKKINLLMLLFCNIIISNCKQPKPDSTIVTAAISSEKSIQNLLLQRWEQNLSDQEDLLKYSDLNEILCQEIQQKQSKCPASLGVEESNIFQCSSKDTPIDLKFSAGITGEIPGEYSIIVDDRYVSSPFKAGEPQIINFSIIDRETRSSPSILQAYKIILKSSDKNEALTNLAGAELILNRGSQTILNSNLSKAKQSNSEYKLDISNLQKVQHNQDCFYDQRRVDNLQKKFNSEASARYAQIRQQQSNPNWPDDEAGQLLALEQLEDMIAGRLPDLETERNRTFKLKQRLLAKAKVGCQAYQKVSDITIELTGNLLPPAEIGAYKNAMKPRGQGGAYDLLFDFGGTSFKLDLNQENIFGTQYVHSVEEDVLIRNINRVQFKKLGVTFDNVRYCETDLIVFTACNYRVFEEGQINIAGMRLYINKHLVYSRPNLDIKLDRNQGSWQGPLQNNEYWLKLMQSENCEEADIE